jgi:copper resistance protein D
MAVVQMLVLARWAHFLAVAILFGTPLFCIYASSGPWRPYSQQHAAIVCASVAATISGLCWLGLSLVDMTGEPASLFDIQLWQSYFFQTGFGVAWIIRLVILTVTVVVALLRREGFRQSAILAALGALLLIDQAWLGHAAATPGSLGVAAITSYAIHVLAASTWIGGLLPLAVELARLRTAADEMALSAARNILQRFSLVGIVAVLAILSSGVVNTAFRMTSWREFFDTNYGLILAAKIALFALMLILAAINRLKLMPRMLANSTSVRRLQFNVIVELMVGAFVLFAAAILGLQPPSS